MRILTLSIFVLTVMLFAACNEPANNANTTAESQTDTTVNITDSVTEEPPVVGNDKDEHGCIGSAGYSWSALKNDCVRFFEVAALKLPGVENEGIVLMVVFDDKKEQAEVLLPDVGSVVLAKKGKSSWVKDGYELKENGAAFSFSESGKVTYQSK